MGSGRQLYVGILHPFANSSTNLFAVHAAADNLKRILSRIVPGATMANPKQNITSMLHETRVFPPPKEFAAKGRNIQRGASRRAAQGSCR